MIKLAPLALAAFLFSSAARADAVELPTPEPAPSFLEWILRALSPTLPLPPPR